MSDTAFALLDERGAVVAWTQAALQVGPADSTRPADQLQHHRLVEVSHPQLVAASSHASPCVRRRPARSSPVSLYLIKPIDDSSTGRAVQAGVAHAVRLVVNNA
ncbi:hypothetical protein ACWGQ5_41230 [Streptomyces sp. NPDC055722]